MVSPDRSPSAIRTSVRIMERTLTPTEKGNIAELMIAAKAVQIGIGVARPMAEGQRYDLIFDIEGRLLRVQCKWGALRDGVIVARNSACRLTNAGYVRSTYSPDEIDILAIYCPELDRVYAIPAHETAGRPSLRLRVDPSRNNQSMLVNWARDYELGAIAQLGERVHGMHEVEGSSPSGSTKPKAA